MKRPSSVLIPSAPNRAFSWSSVAMSFSRMDFSCEVVWMPRSVRASIRSIASRSNGSSSRGFTEVLAYTKDSTGSRPAPIAFRAPAGVRGT